jgi:ATP-dependent helicase HrpB
MAALGNDPRLAAMLVAAQDDDEIATAAKLAAILEEPPRGGSSDLGQRFRAIRETGSSGRSSSGG